uniref:Uncharacterized protein n=1 Tax=Percolomonas cosmopolitus TaxID=63605 RepID=A0A7S1KM77_9EUKA|mmetsp:Transcript_11413/g.42858  ORF Transcript_11413/g.42858 Transcript_11413/m.42858 type:complete len:682 (+) Transcript_11413:223-2268(+)
MSEILDPSSADFQPLDTPPTADADESVTLALSPPLEGFSEDTLPAIVSPAQTEEPVVLLTTFKPNLLVNILSFLPFEILMIVHKLTARLWPFLGIEVALRENLETVSGSFDGYLEERRAVQIQQYMHHLQYCMDKVNADEILSSSGVSAQATLVSPKMESSLGVISTNPAQQSHLQEHRMRVIAILRILLGFKLPRSQKRNRFTRSLDNEHWLLKPLLIRRISSEKARARKIRLQKKRLHESGATRFYVTPSVFTGQRSSNFYSFENTPTNKKTQKKKKPSSKTSSPASTATPRSAALHPFASPRNFKSSTPSPRTIRTPLTPPDNLLDRDLELLLSQLFEHCSSLNLLQNSINEEKLEFILPFITSLNAVKYTDLEPLKSYRYIFLWILAVLDFRRHLNLYSWYFSGADIDSILLQPHMHIVGSTTISEENEKGCLSMNDDEVKESTLSKYTYEVTTSTEEQGLSSSLTRMSGNAHTEKTEENTIKSATVTIPVPLTSTSAVDLNGKSFSQVDSDLETVPKLNLRKSNTDSTKKNPKTPRSSRSANPIQSPRSSASFIQSPRGKELFPHNISQEPQKTLPMSSTHKFQHMSKEEFEKRKMRRQQKLVEMEKNKNNMQPKSKKKPRNNLKSSQPMRPTSRLEVLLNMSSEDNLTKNMRLTPKRIEQLVEKKLGSNKMVATG